MGRWIILPTLLCFILNAFTVTAQVKIANHWYFGDGTNLDFSSGSPVVGQNSGIFTFEGSATYSDANGDLLFYTNGGPFLPNFSGGIWNANHVLMDNGNLDSANGSLSSRQGTFAFPDPKIPDIFHMLTTDCNENQKVGGLRYNKIDMSENGGLGKVVVKDSLVYRQPNGREDIHGILNAEGDGYWVFMVFRNLLGMVGQDTVVSFEVTGAGISGPFQQIFDCETCNHQAAAPNGRNYIFGENLFNIVPSTGQLSNQIIFPSASGMQCAIFSPNSNLIYACQNLGNGSQLYQYRVDTTDITASELAIESFSWFGGVYSMQMGPDGKLYLLSTLGNIGVVECPNKRGVDCNVNLNFLTLPPPGSGILPLEFPNYPSHFFASNDSCGAVVVGQTEVVEKQMFMAVPNPASEVVRVHLENSGYGEEWVRLRLIGIDGREIVLMDKTARSFPIEIDLREVPPGIYFIEAQRGGEYFHQRLIVE